MARYGCLLALVALIGFAGSARAQVIVDSHGFESPFFTTTFNGTGQLEGQTPATVNGTWAADVGGTGTATVQNSIFQSGSQAVRVDRAANSDDRWAVPLDGFPSSGNLMTVFWDMRVEQTTGPTSTFGPFLGMEAFDDDAASIGLLGSLGVDATTGDVLFQAADTGFFTETGTVVTFGAWNSYAVEFDFSANTYRGFVNGTQVASAGFVDENNIAGGLDELTDANISALSAAGDAGSLALTGTAYFDNFIVFQGAVPEPGLLGLLPAALVLLRRTRGSRADSQ